MKSWTRRALLASSADPPLSAQEPDGFGAICRTDLPQRGRDVRTNRTGRQRQPFGNLVRRQALLEQLEDFPLAGGQAGPSCCAARLHARWGRTRALPSSRARQRSAAVPRGRGSHR